MSIPAGLRRRTGSSRRSRRRASLASQERVLLRRAARLAPVVPIDDVERLLVGERALDARPRAHVAADLLAHVPGEQVRRAGQDADPGIGQHRRLKRGQLHDERRRVGEVEHPRSARPPGDHQPQEVLRGPRCDLLGGPGRGVELLPVAPVALEETLDPHEQIGPDRLRAQVAAPHPSGDCVHEEQGEGRQDQQTHDVVDFLWPQLDEKEIEAAVGEIDQHRLRRLVRAPAPTDEGKDVVDAEGRPEERPLDRAELPFDADRVDLLARLVERIGRARCLGFSHVRLPRRGVAIAGHLLSRRGRRALTCRKESMHRTSGTGSPSQAWGRTRDPPGAVACPDALYCPPPRLCT
jgi:hypothetical protein